MKATFTELLANAGKKKSNVPPNSSLLAVRNEQLLPNIYMHKKHYTLQVLYTASNFFLPNQIFLKPPSQQQINLLIPQITISQRTALYPSLRGDSSTDHE